MLLMQLSGAENAISNGVKGHRGSTLIPMGIQPWKEKNLEPVSFQQEAEAAEVSDLPLLSPPRTLTKSQEIQARPPVSR